MKLLQNSILILRSRKSCLDVMGVFFTLFIAFASYDIILLIFGNANSLLNVMAFDGHGIAEGSMYFSGVGKTILFDPYLKEHAADLTLRPILPTLIFSGIYWLCAQNLDLAIFVGHSFFPLISCWLLYAIGMELTQKRSLAIFAMLLGVGHFMFSLLRIAAAITGAPFGGLAGPDFYLIKQVADSLGILGHVSALNNIGDPNHFSRLYSPVLTLPFLLLPILMLLKNRSALGRGALISLNLYVYPHHIIILGFLEVAFWIKNKRLPSIGFFIVGVLTAIPFFLQQIIVYKAGVYGNIYGRLGQTSDLSSLWFFIPFFGIITAYSFWKERFFSINVAFNLGCFASAVCIYLLDQMTKFPQVHLIGLRMYAFLAPFSLVGFLALQVRSIPRGLNLIALLLVVYSQTYPAWIHRHEFSLFPKDGFALELSSLPNGSVVMTDVQAEISYISSASKAYSYVGNSIVSAASNQELMKRLVIVARIYDWSIERMHGGDWDGLMPMHHWVYHHGEGMKASPEVKRTVDAAYLALDGLSKCELLNAYQVDYIRFRVSPPKGLEACTKPYSDHLLKVIH